MFEAKAISMQGPVVLAKQSVQSNDMHLLPFPVGKRRFAAIRSHQSPTSPSVLVFTNVTQTWIDGKLRYWHHLSEVCHSFAKYQIAWSRNQGIVMHPKVK